MNLSGFRDSGLILHGGAKCLVSEHGDVFITGKLLKTGIISKGRKPFVKCERYKSVALLVGKNKRKRFYIHRLVAFAFIENPLNKNCVNHIDGNKMNNHYSNLEWCTVAENNEHAFVTGLSKRGRTIKPYVSVKTEWGNFRPILDINTGIFYKITELPKILGYSYSHIKKMLNGERDNKIKNYVMA